jgi:hypothetical protein
MLLGPVLTALFASVVCTVPRVPLPPHEPLLARGPTELVAGLYLQGGAFVIGCAQEPRGPFAGTIRVSSTHTGKLVARQTLRHSGKLFVLKLVPGTYMVRARNSGGVAAAPVRVTVPANRTVRQDLFIDVP